VNSIILSTTPELSELKELMRTLDMEVERIFVQERTMHPKFFFGAGKTEEVKEYLEEHEEIESVVVNAELKPAQPYYLEKELKRRVYDRINLILEIFTRNAHSREAKLQVELADLKYQIPFIREYIHTAKKGEHPGFMAGGEYAVDDYYLFIRRRITRIQRELERIRKDREAKRKARKEKGFYLVSIAGYTNAGKSTLLNALSGENILVEDRMFSTLSTTTRRINSKRKILITDTVGFIRDLPPWMVSAFRATLEEVFESDLVLLILDVSDPADVMIEKLKASEDVLFPDIGGTPIILVLNKMDKIDPEELEMKKNLIKDGRYRAIVPISALSGLNLDVLVNEIEKIFSPEIRMEITMPNSPESESLLSWIYENADVVDVERSEKIRVIVECDEDVMGKIEERVGVVGGEMKPINTPYD
jgi:GTP-binding protein HflX